ncbi:hypothetical protein JHK87_020304 [Glycine soja]|nr:hypothetical protein JHK87_020304 [Glycine soja]
MNISGCWVSSMKLPFLGWRFSRPYLSLFFFFFVSHYDHSKLFFFGFHINVGFEGEEEGSSFTLVNCWPRQSRQKVGFEMVDTIAEAEGISMTTVSFKALFGKGFIGDVPVILAKPQTFMNLSGESVGTIVSYYKIPVKQVLVIVDDLDLPFAKLRLLPKGGHGGHNGWVWGVYISFGGGWKVVVFQGQGMPETHYFYYCNINWVIVILE